MAARESRNRSISALRRESIGAGAAAAAARGSVVGMVLTSGVGVAAPLAGLGIGAVIGAILGYGADAIIQRRRDDAHDGWPVAPA